ncbi:transcriptional regulator FilR1 domain-containing protein [uncultured Methanolobus sp.]|uniref:helix-turn-helix transcriptional regulator n=1 Tax=uncultured Methanolobus sp. TaxID=218300 RepID=UPI0029C80188|nr:transcriptional regulator FilR1 domain-containing protein [uncultured Methanolobus sp.]
MKVLEEHYLVDHYDDTYELTHIGELIVDEMAPLLSTLEVLDHDIDYWGTHNLNFIPPHLLQRIDKLRKSRVITPPFADIYKLNDEILETSPISKSHYGVVTFYHPLFPVFLSNMISHNVNVYLIVPQPVLDVFRTEHSTQFEKLMQSELFHFSVYPGNLGFVGLACNDYYFMIRLLKSNGEYDTKYILCNNKEAFEWGKELFEYYLKDSTRIIEI